MVLMESEHRLSNNLDLLQLSSQCEEQYSKRGIVKRSEMLIASKSVFC